MQSAAKPATGLHYFIDFCQQLLYRCNTTPVLRFVLLQKFLIPYESIASQVTSGQNPVIWALSDSLDVVLVRTIFQPRPHVCLSLALHVC